MKLKELRKANGLLQSDIANALGISKATYSTYEIGTRTPPADMLCKLADYFNVTTDYLLGRTLDNISESAYIPGKESFSNANSIGPIANSFPNKSLEHLNGSNNLKTARLAKGLLQKDIAKILNITPATYCGWEKGKFEIDNKNLLRLADLLNTSTDFLLGRTSNYTPIDSTATNKIFEELFAKLDELERNQIVELTKFLAYHKK